jgi:hypothetical protein
VKKALLVLGDGTVVELDGRFVLITETAGDRPELSVVDWYQAGRHLDGCIYNTRAGALTGIAHRRFGRARKRTK